jgi:hypothetical protein
LEAKVEGEDSTVQPKALPELRFLKVENLTTFPANLELRPLRGITVIFGGNYSGKTTFVNSVKFGIFGLTLNREEEETSARYFGSRIKESERKSMDITTTMALGRLIVTVKRKLFTSGPQAVDVQVFDPNASPAGGIVESHNTSREYISSLTQMVGLEGRDEVEFLLSLLIADEDRRPVIWRKDCGKISLKLLIPAESYSRLRWLDQELRRKKSELSKTISASQGVAQRLDRQIGIRQFFEAESGRLHSGQSPDTLEKFRELEVQHQEIAQRLQNLQQKNRDALTSKSNGLDALAKMQGEKQTRIARIDDLKTEKYRAIMRSTDPEDIHVTKHLIHMKRCPYCDSDLAPEIERREAQHLCFLCGNEIHAPNARGIPEINALIASEEVELKNVQSETEKITSEIKSVDTELVKLDQETIEIISAEKTLSDQISRMREVAQLQQRIVLVDENLISIREKVTTDTSEYERLEKTVSALKTELEEIESLRLKGEEVARTRSREIFTKVSNKFSEFAKVATNGELDARLGPDMIPSIQGRKIYSVDDASQFERMILDVGFRIALLSTIGEQSGFAPFLIIETPDETCDESYIKHLAEALGQFSSNISLLVTSSNTEFMRVLLGNCPSSERSRKLVDLSVTGTDTQKSYYSPLISQWLGS